MPVARWPKQAETWKIFKIPFPLISSNAVNIHSFTQLSAGAIATVMMVKPVIQQCLPKAGK